MDIERIFKTYYRPLCLYAMHYLAGDADMAEDIVQDCFVKIWQYRPEHPKPFLYTAVRNACIDHMRRNKAETRNLLPEDTEGYITDPEAQSRSQWEAALWTAIDSLPERCRQLFLMSKRDGMTYREIAVETGLSEKTVEHQISKAIKRLKNQRHDFRCLLPCLC